MLTLALQCPVTLAPYPYLTLTLALTNQARDCSRASARAYLFVGPRLSPSSVEFSRALASRNQFTTPSYTVASCRLPGEPGGRTSPLRTHTVTPRDGQARARPRRVPAAALALAPSARLLLEEGDRLRSGDRTQELDRKTDLTDRQTGISDGAPSTEDTRAGHSTSRTAD